MNSTGGLVAPVWVTTLVVERGATSCNSPNHPPRATPRGPTTSYQRAGAGGPSCRPTAPLMGRWWLDLPIQTTHPMRVAAFPPNYSRQRGVAGSLWWLIPLGGSAQRRRQQKRRRLATAEAEPAVVRTRSLVEPEDGCCPWWYCGSNSAPCLRDSRQLSTHRGWIR